MLTIREAQPSDLEALDELYRFHLVETPPPPADRAALRHMYERISADENYHLLVGESGRGIASSVTCVVVPNLTHGGRPYALVENVVTRADARGRGHASALMERARRVAQNAGCYKVMLMTGSKKEGTLAFYEKCGYNRRDKTGFVKWL